MLEGEGKGPVRRLCGLGCQRKMRIRPWRKLAKTVVRPPSEPLSVLAVRKRFSRTSSQMKLHCT